MDTSLSDIIEACRTLWCGMHRFMSQSIILQCMSKTWTYLCPPVFFTDNARYWFAMVSHWLCHALFPNFFKAHCRYTVIYCNAMQWMSGKVQWPPLLMHFWLFGCTLLFPSGFIIQSIQPWQIKCPLVYQQPPLFHKILTVPLFPCFFCSLIPHWA